MLNLKQIIYVILSSPSRIHYHNNASLKLRRLKQLQTQVDINSHPKLKIHVTLQQLEVAPPIGSMFSFLLSGSNKFVKGIKYTLPKVLMYYLIQYFEEKKD